MKTKIFISQAMNGRNDKEILEEREKAAAWALDVFKEIEVVDSFVVGLSSTPLGGKEPLVYLGRSIEKMAEADVIVMWGDWRNARGCLIEREVAIKYGIPIIENGGEK